MSIKTISDVYEEILSKGTPEEVFADADLRNKLIYHADLFVKFSTLAQSVILERIKEVDFVRFMLMVQKSLISTMTLDGCDGLLLAELEGSLQVYTQNVILATVGALIEDEVL